MPTHSKFHFGLNENNIFIILKIIFPCDIIPSEKYFKNIKYRYKKKL